jgi:hypothetical protein
MYPDWTKKIHNQSLQRTATPPLTSTLSAEKDINI